MNAGSQADDRRQLAVTPTEKLHRLVDELTEDELRVAEEFLEYLRDKRRERVRRAFEEAAEVDEPLSDEDKAAIRESEEEFARGEGVPLDAVLKHLRRAG